MLDKENIKSLLATVLIDYYSLFNNKLIPENGLNGQILSKNTDSVEWIDLPNSANITVEASEIQPADENIILWYDTSEPDNVITTYTKKEIDDKLTNAGASNSFVASDVQPVGDNVQVWYDTATEHNTIDVYTKTEITQLLNSLQLVKENNVVQLKLGEAILSSINI